jgi:hypothetical protein
VGPAERDRDAAQCGRSTGNEPRCAGMFIANFGHWIRGEPMFNVQQVSTVT